MRPERRGAASKAAPSSRRRDGGPRSVAACARQWLTRARFTAQRERARAPPIGPRGTSALERLVTATTNRRTLSAHDGTPTTRVTHPVRKCRLPRRKRNVHAAVQGHPILRIADWQREQRPRARVTPHFVIRGRESIELQGSRCMQRHSKPRLLGATTRAKIEPFRVQTAIEQALLTLLPARATH